MADFASTTTTQPPGPWGRLEFKYSADIVNDPELMDLVRNTEDIIEERLQGSGMSVIVDWDLVPGTAGGVVQLTIRDRQTNAEVQRPFSHDDLIQSLRFSLFLMWDDLLQEIGRKKLELLTATAGALGN